MSKKKKNSKAQKKNIKQNNNNLNNQKKRTTNKKHNYQKTTKQKNNKKKKVVTNNNVKKQNTINNNKKKKNNNNKKQNINKKITYNNKNNNINKTNKEIIDKKIIQNNIDNKNNNTINKKTPKNKTKNIILIILLTIMILLIILFTINLNIKINLIGSKNESIEVFNEYNDPGYKITLFNKPIKKKVTINSNLETNKLGTYKITYKTKFITSKSITRTINVIDTESPTLTLNGDETINIYIFDKYTDKGVTIKDNYDTNLDDKLIIENNLNTNKVGTYTITYTITDSSNNTTSIKRTINVKEKVIKTSNNNSCTISNSIEEYICKNNYDISVGYYNLTNNKSYYYKNTKLYYGASLIKTLDVLYLYDKNLINDNLKPYVKKAITVSDNPSHHYLVNYIGRENLKQYGISLGAYNTLNGSDNFALTSVNDQIIYMKKLYELTKNNQNDELKQFFLNTRKNCLLFENSPLIMHKYGHWTYVYHNSGIVLDKNPYIVVILTNEGYDNYQTIISTISKMVYEYHIKNTF